MNRFIFFILTSSTETKFKLLWAVIQLFPFLEVQQSDQIEDTEENNSKNQRRLAQADIKTFYKFFRRILQAD
jgi:hypothetical protein